MGALVGIVLAGASTVYIMSNRQHDAAIAREKAEGPRPDPHRLAPTAAAGVTTEKYDFYEMLPNFEVVVPEKEKDVKRDPPATAQIERQGVYVLQAGSYRNEADADRVRAQLAMQGIDAKV
ncbi:MAG: SPOR domain-containing protein, partial [Sinobacteraceae bacterium]|nr:SPOR domain-containing protein [Nevskiaceae bacterium]